MEKNQVNQSMALQGDGHFVQLAPHIRSNDTVTKIMRDVIIALIPAIAGSVYFFGMSAVWIYLISIVCCVASEYIFQKLTKKPIQVGDLSAVVTGILLAMNMPAGVPWYVVAIGAVFAIVLVKECFGGIGGNFVNPALAARAMCMASWPGLMTAYTNPDGIAAATPLSIIKQGGDLSALPSLSRMFIGDIGGVIGETSALLLLIGALYLIIRKVIDWKTPVIYVIVTAIFCLILGIPTDLLPYEVLGGGLFLGAFFMATDYSSTPANKKGKIIFAIGCGLLTAVIRTKGSMAEGVSYSILLMNVASPLIDRLTKTEAYGEAK
ncbi:RnfABCDGE type electron transport complex subunit D [Peptoniphilus sp. KCTC 25270]|uniref:RnfABCDGE type electron transport complex subunit D n=1 Tax=Peptoniphilus sp. KCTC 25270 TaxID=2897414 RepID=UPI00351D2CB5